MLYIYTLKELESMPTLEHGHDADLKVEDIERGIRIWLSRLGVEDGMPFDNAVIIEKRINDKWVVVYEYQAEQDTRLRVFFVYMKIDINKLIDKLSKGDIIKTNPTQKGMVCNGSEAC